MENVRNNPSILTNPPSSTTNFKHKKFEELPNEGVEILDQIQNHFPIIQTVEDVLETMDESSEIFQEHLLPEPLLQTRLRVMDVVAPDDTRTCCFTKAYGSYVKGTGSVFCPFSRNTSVFKRLAEEPLENEALRDFQLRYFTPREVARLMSFPEKFTFPLHATRKQKYRLLGNSLNVKVVAVLIKLMLSEPQELCGTER